MIMMIMIMMMVYVLGDCGGYCSGSDTESQGCQAGMHYQPPQLHRHQSSCHNSHPSKQKILLGNGGGGGGVGTPYYWSGWSDWGSCSTTCGTGKSTRTRTCNGNVCLSQCGCVIGECVERHGCARHGCCGLAGC